MRDTMKHRKDDVVPKGFLYAIFVMVMFSLLVVFSVSLFPGYKSDVPEKIEILEKENLVLTKLSDGSVSIANLENEELSYGKLNFKQEGIIIATNNKHKHKSICLQIKKIIKKYDLCAFYN